MGLFEAHTTTDADVVARARALIVEVVNAETISRVWRERARDFLISTTPLGEHSGISDVR